MDLKHDWKALNDVLFQDIGASAATTSSVVLLEDEDRVMDGIVSSGKAFSDVGVTGIVSKKQLLDELGVKYGADQTLVLSKKTLDQCLIEAAGLGTNYFQQLQALRVGVLERAGRKQGGFIVSRKHFLLDLFGVKLRRVVPKRFNVLLFIDQRHTEVISTSPFSYRAILLSYANGQLDQFFEPDFSSLHENRLKNWHHESDAIGQYLESRYILPCYGLFLHEKEWQRCLQAGAQKRGPWKLFVRYHDGGQAAVYPNGFLAKALLTSQRLTDYFGRACQVARNAGNE